MSNCLPVTVNNKIKYYPFHWVERDGSQMLEVWNDKEWLPARRTNRKGIFEITDAEHAQKL